MAFTLIVFAAVVAAVLGLVQLAAGSIGLVAIVGAVLAGALAASSVHVVMEWEKAVARC